MRLRERNGRVTGCKDVDCKNNLMNRFVATLVRFRAARKGSIAIGFAVTSFVIMASVGIGIDVARVINEKTKAQAAVDSAALAANYEADTYTAEQMRQAGERYFDAVYQAPEGGTLVRTVTVDQGKVTVTATVGVKTTLTALMGEDSISFTVLAETFFGRTSFDVVMVLDNSGSMRGSKISTLRSAAKDLARTLFALNNIGDIADRVKIGLVPFTSNVNVGSQYANESWMDREGRSPIHWTNFQTENDGDPDPSLFNSSYLYNGRPSRFSLFSEFGNTPWKGCIEARPMPYDVNDEPASTGNPSTLYVPQFAVDEPDSENRNGYSYHNNYIDDEGGYCNWSSYWSAYYNRYDQNDNTNHGSLARHEVAQGRLCKYRRSLNLGSDYNSGPNFWCRAQPLTDLTDTQSTIINAIDDMEANGATNVHMGLMWGWRMITPQAPLTSGREPSEQNDGDHRRILIVMTDGKNTYYSGSGHNVTRPNAYGFGAEERLGNNINTANEIMDAMNDRTALACENAKNYELMQVYTIAFQVPDDDTKDMLEACATTPQMYYDSGSNSELREAFENIAREISKLRLAK